MDQGVFQICRVERDKDVSVVKSHFELLTHVQIVYQRVDNAQPLASLMSLVVICMPLPFPFKITKVFTLQYDITAIMNGQEEHIEEKPKEAARNDVTHIVGTSRMSHICHIFALEQSQRVASDVSKGPTNEVSNPCKESDLTKNYVPLNEAGEFLKFIKRNDYKVVDQLSQTP